jgi:ribosomal protein L37AE/L43A
MNDSTDGSGASSTQDESAECPRCGTETSKRGMWTGWFLCDECEMAFSEGEAA